MLFSSSSWVNMGLISIWVDGWVNSGKECTGKRIKEEWMIKKIISFCFVKFNGLKIFKGGKQRNLPNLSISQDPEHVYSNQSAKFDFVLGSRISIPQCTGRVHLQGQARTTSIHLVWVFEQESPWKKKLFPSEIHRLYALPCIVSLWVVIGPFLCPRDAWINGGSWANFGEWTDM